MNLWMRYVNFRALRDILSLVAMNSGQLRASDVSRLATKKRILVSKSGQALGPTSHYHHRRTLERLGLLVKQDGRYSIRDDLPESRILASAATCGRPLNRQEKGAFANLVLRNKDCMSAFFERFIENGAPIHSVEEFVSLAESVELRVTHGSRGQRRHQAKGTQAIGMGETNVPSEIAIRPIKSSDWYILTGTNAVQAIHYGLRSWGVDQLTFLDDIYRSGSASFFIFPRNITGGVSQDELSLELVNALKFEGDWATIRVSDLSLDLGVRFKVSIEQVKRVLNSWLENHPDLVAGIKTNQRFVTSAVHSTQYDAVLKGFLLSDGGAVMSHLRIHRDIIARIGGRGLKV